MKITVTSLEAHAENQVLKGPWCHQNANNENPSCLSCLPFIFPFSLSSFFQRGISRRNPHASQKWGPHDHFAPWPMKDLNHRHSFLGMWGMQQLERQSILMKPQHLPQPPLFPPSPPSPPSPPPPKEQLGLRHMTGREHLHYESPTVETGTHFTFKCLNWLILSDNIFLKAFLPS